MVPQWMAAGWFGSNNNTAPGPQRPVGHPVQQYYRDRRRVPASAAVTRTLRDASCVLPMTYPRRGTLSSVRSLTRERAVSPSLGVQPSCAANSFERTARQCFGMRSLRALLEHPKLSLVGLYVHSEAKAGSDAGELCGLGALGVKATRSIDEIIALQADCVLYMPQGCNFDELCRLLTSGANVVTTRSELLEPDALDPAVREPLDC